MLEEQPVLFRRSPSRRRLRPGFDTDDRGWTSLHVFARKGDIKLVMWFSYPPYVFYRWILWLEWEGGCCLSGKLLFEVFEMGKMLWLHSGYWFIQFRFLVCLEVSILLSLLGSCHVFAIGWCPCPNQGKNDRYRTCTIFIILVWPKRPVWTEGCFYFEVAKNVVWNLNDFPFEFTVEGYRLTLVLEYIHILHHLVILKSIYPCGVTKP